STCRTAAAATRCSAKPSAAHTFSRRAPALGASRRGAALLGYHPSPSRDRMIPGERDGPHGPSQGGWMGTELLKDCPSCGIRIAEPAIKCTSCNSSLGQCVGCKSWIVSGTECMDCGKSTAVRVRKATLASEPEPAKIRFDVPPAFGLLPILGLRA